MDGGRECLTWAAYIESPKTKKEKDGSMRGCMGVMVMECGGRGIKGGKKWYKEKTQNKRRQFLGDEELEYTGT